MIAVYAFFVLQLLFGLLLSKAQLPDGSSTLYGFTLAGLVTCGLSWLHFRRKGAAGVPTYLSRNPARSLLYGALAGACCAMFAAIYMDAMERTGWFPELLEQSMGLDRNERIWVALLAVVAAPVFEEFIFRGLVYKGLSKTLRPMFAIAASAALFAAVHPPVAVVPVFVLGLVTAALYRWQGSLLISVTTHAVYNFSVILVPWITAR
jgi:ABC-2 type transport system permease protein